MRIEDKVQNLFASNGMEILGDPLAIRDIGQRLLRPDQFVEDGAEG
jgi:hypothetical protein